MTQPPEQPTSQPGGGSPKDPLRHVSIVLTTLSVTVAVCNGLFPPPTLLKLVAVGIAVALAVNGLSALLTLGPPVVLRTLWERTWRRRRPRSARRRLAVASILRASLPSLVLLVLAGVVVLLLMPAPSWVFDERLRAGHGEFFVPQAITPDGRYHASGDWGYIARLVDLHKGGRPIAAQDAAGLDHGAPIARLALTWSPPAASKDSIDGLTLYAVTGRGDLIVWQRDPKSHEWSERRRRKHVGAATGLAVDPSRDLIVTAGSDGQLRFTRIGILAPFREWVSDMAIDPSPVFDVHVIDRGESLAVAVLHQNGLVEIAWPQSLRTVATWLQCGALRYGVLEPQGDSIGVAGIEESRFVADARGVAPSPVHLVVFTLPLAGSGSRKDAPAAIRAPLRLGTPGSVALTREWAAVGYYREPSESAAHLELFDRAGRRRAAWRVSESVKGLLFDPARKRLLVGIGAEPFPVDLTTMTLSRRPLVEDLRGDLSAVTWLDEQRFVTGDAAGSLWLWHCHAPLESRREADVGDKIVRLASLGKRRLLVVTRHGRVLEVDATHEPWREREILVAGADTITASAVDMGKHQVLVARANRVVTASLNSQGAPEFSPICPQSISAIEASGDGRVFVGTQEGALYVYEPGAGFASILNVVAPAVRSIEYVARDHVLAVLDEEGSLQTYRERAAGLRSGAAVSEHGTSLKLVDRGRARQLISVDSGYVIAWRDWANRHRLKRYGHPADVTALALSPKGDKVAACFGRFTDVWERSRLLQ